MTDSQIQPYRSAILSAEKLFNKYLPKEAQMTFERESALAIQILQKSKALMDIAASNPASITKAVCNLALVGLSLNPATGYAYLIPRKGEACLDISYKGMMKLATDTGSLKYAKADVVFKDDDFQYNGPTEKPNHRANPFVDDRGPMVGVYCICKTADNDYLIETMSKADIDVVQQASPSSTNSDSPWRKYPAEMWKKVCIKRALKTVPSTERGDRMAEAVRISDEAMGTAPVTQNHTEEQYDYFLGILGQTDIDADSGDVFYPDAHSMKLYVFVEQLLQEEILSIYGKYKSGIERGMKDKHMNGISDVVKLGREATHKSLEAMLEAEDTEAMMECYLEVSREVQDWLYGQIPAELQDVVAEQSNQ